MDISISKHLAIRKKLNAQTIILQQVIINQNKSIEKKLDRLIENNKKHVKTLQ